MTKKHFYALLVPTSHLITGKLEGIKLHTLRRLRQNYKALEVLHTELQGIETEAQEKGLSPAELEEERKIWGDEAFTSAAEVYNFEEHHFDNCENEVINGRTLDAWVEMLFASQEKIKNSGE